MKALFFTLILFASCTQQAELSKDSFGIRISGVKMDISQLDEISWWIGAKKKEVEVTQSITFLLDMPKVKEDDLNHLLKGREIDSWLVRVIQIKGSKSQDLGSLLTPFFPRHHGRAHRSTAGLAAIKIYYAAAYASERLRNFKCPAFAHDKRITGMSVEGDNRDFEINVGTFKSYMEKSQEVQLTPSSFNGGNSLQGEFHFEIAPYNSKKHGLMGDFKRIPRFVKIKTEQSIDVKSCKGVHPELD